MIAKNLKNVLLKAIVNRRRILLVGKPGMGKTAILKWARSEASKILGLDVDMTTLYVSVSDPTDFKGFYCIIDGKPQIMPFGDLEKIYNADRLHIVFLDDFGQGATATQAASMSFLDRVKDNPNVVVLAATNSRADRAGVSGLLEPVKSRFDSIIEMEFDMDSWVDWALTADVPIELIAFNKFRPQLMYSMKPCADLVNGPCPRTVEALGNLMKDGHNPADEYEVYKGAVGEAYTAELMGFLPIWRKLPNIDSILLDPMNVPLPQISDKYGPSILFAITSALARKAEVIANFDRICEFSTRLPVEFSVCLIVDSVKQNRDVQNTKAYIQWQSRNKSVLI